jgi:hypothetical protein
VRWPLGPVLDHRTLRLWEVATGACLRRFRPDRLYEGMVITGATGLSFGQRAAWLSLGALNRA